MKILSWIKRRFYSVCFEGVCFEITWQTSVVVSHRKLVLIRCCTQSSWHWFSLSRYHAHSKHWSFLWLEVESDFMTTLQVFDNLNIVPWDLNRWSNCLAFGLTLKLSHISSWSCPCTHANEVVGTVGTLTINASWWFSSW
jgi:hypothetical protein